MNHGNQHASRKRDLMDYLTNARLCVAGGLWEMARYWLDVWRVAHSAIPASTRRRWKCGR